MEAPRSLSGSRRVLAGQLARGLCLGALILALLGSAAAPAAAAAEPGVVVTGPGGAQGFVPEAWISAETPRGSTEYLERATPGEAGVLRPHRGVPVLQVIEASKVPFDAAGYLTIARPKGTVAYLENEDFEEESPIFEERKRALISVDERSTHFFRPVFADVPDDVNVEDFIATVSGEALTIGLYDGNVLSVQAAATPTSAAAGQAVQFSATATGGEPGEGISSYRWNFGDGSTAEGQSQSVTHTFSGAGTYAVRVTATGSAESGGESGPVEVVVGNPPTTAQPGAAPVETKAQRKHKANGASGKGGQGQGGEGSKRRGGNTSKGGEGGGQAGGGDGPAGSQGEPSSGAPAPLEPVPPPAPEPAAPASEGSEGGEAAAPAPAAKQPASSAQPLTGGETVEGTLVADLFEPVAAVTGGSSAGSGSDSAPGAVDHGGGTSVPVAALIVLGLLAAGVLLEWRGARPRIR